MGTHGLPDTYIHPQPSGFGYIAISGKPLLPMLQLLATTIASISEQVS